MILILFRSWQLAKKGVLSHNKYVKNDIVMKLTSIQQALYDYIKRVHSEYSRAFVLDVQDLWEHLLASGFQLSKSDVVGVLQELQALDVGLRLLKSRVEGDIWAVHLKWVMSPAERTKHWREEQAKMGRKARMLYLTDQEYKQVMKVVEELHQSN